MMGKVFVTPYTYQDKNAWHWCEQKYSMPIGVHSGLWYDSFGWGSECPNEDSVVWLWIIIIGGKWLGIQECFWGAINHPSKVLKKLEGSIAKTQKLLHINIILSASPMTNVALVEARSLIDLSASRTQKGTTGCGTGANKRLPDGLTKFPFKPMDVAYYSTWLQFQTTIAS
jgi:hypothetical protein